MDILETKAVRLPIENLVNNEGQIAGVPANPRVLRDEKYEALKASMQKDNLTGVLPLKVIEHEGEYIVLGGNMRLQVLKELGAADVACIIVPTDTPAEVLRKIVITDNSTFGDWDMDMLANEWEVDELKDWGVELPSFLDEEEKEQKDLSDEIETDFKIEVTCTCEKEQENLYNELTSQGYECRILTL